MSKYSASSSDNSILHNHNASIVNTPLPTNERTDPVAVLEGPPTSLQLPQNVPSLSPTHSVSAKNSKQKFISIFKKKDGNTINIGSANRHSTPPPQRVVPDHNNKMNTAEEAIQNVHHFEAPHHVPQSIIGSAGVPDFSASNTDISDDEEDATTKEQERDSAYSVSDETYGLENGITGSSLSINSKKYGKRKGSIVSQIEDLGFKNTMKNTVRKTSTFFKKFGNKQNPENSPTNDGRLPIPDFHDGPNSQSSSPNNLPNTIDSDTPPDEPSLPEQLVSPPFNVSFSDKIFTDRDMDEQDVLQRTLRDYASVYVNMNDNVYNHEKASVKSTSKSVVDDDGKISQPESMRIGQSSLSNGREKGDHNKRIGGKTFIMSLPMMKNEKKVESKVVLEELSTNGLPRVKEEDDEENTKTFFKPSNLRGRSADTSSSGKNVSIASHEDLPLTFSRTPSSSPPARDADKRVSRSSSKPSLHSSKSTTSLLTQGSLTVETEFGSLRSANSKWKPALSKSSSHGSFRERKEEEVVTSDRRTLRAIADQRGLIVKPRPESAETASSIASSYYETASASTATLHTAPPSPVTETNEGTPKIQVNEINSSEESCEDEMSPSGVSERMDDDDVAISEAKNAAKRCFDEDETFVKKEAIAEFLGGIKPLNSRALKFYMGYFDFANLKLDMAFRRLCEKLYIKGETQQVDRILEAFSKRYWECNPKTIFGSADVVHAIAYSILLLNTDLHIAQLSSKMTRAQFIRNTMTTVHEANAAQSNNNDASEDDQSTITSLETSTTPTSARPRRSSSIKSWLSNQNSSMTNLSFAANGSSRQWESELENLLKDMYNSIKSNQILLPLLSDVEKSSSSLSPGLHRSLSHSGYPNTRLNALMARARRSSPSPSVISGGSDISGGNDSQVRSGPSSLSLRHTSSCETEITAAITEEECEDDKASIADSIGTNESLELYLSGAPYAKEGLLVRKHFRESTNKRAKDKSWKECFVVVEKGELRMFKFDTQSSRGSTGMGAIGGGNWMANATVMGQVNLCHTITNALPPPGYNRDRPFVFALLTHNGGLYFFQAGTAELVEEWVSTCNYWAARLSKEPLPGGVSNMEYGWGRCLEQNNDGSSDFDDSRSVMSDPRSIMSSVSSYTSDRVFISEWKMPIPPSVPSNHDEVPQLEALQKYRDDLENELKEHKNFWDPMSKFFHPRSPNHSKAVANWEKKSQWLLYEIVKYTTYIESIERSVKHKVEMRKAKIKDIETAEEPNTKNNNPTIVNENNEKERERPEPKDRAKLSIQRATWTPGDGYSLNLPKELLFDDAVDDADDGIINTDFIGLEAALTAAKNRNNKNKSATHLFPETNHL